MISYNITVKTEAWQRHVHRVQELLLHPAVVTILLLWQACLQQHLPFPGSVRSSAFETAGMLATQ